MYPHPKKQVNARMLNLTSKTNHCPRYCAPRDAIALDYIIADPNDLQMAS